MKPLDRSKRRELICMVGLPRSGKSTRAMALSIDLRAPIVERDSIRLALHGQPYIAIAEPLVKVIDDLMIRTLFHTGYTTVIVDETNFSKAARQRRISPDWDTSFVVVDTPPDVCKERAIITGQDYLLPVIDEMHARYEPLGPEEKVFAYQAIVV